MPSKQRREGGGEAQRALRRLARKEVDQLALASLTHTQVEQQDAHEKQAPRRLQHPPALAPAPLHRQLVLSPPSTSLC